jgi:hypothetical protein
MNWNERLKMIRYLLHEASKEIYGETLPITWSLLKKHVPGHNNPYTVSPIKRQSQLIIKACFHSTSCES